MTKSLKRTEPPTAPAKVMTPDAPALRPNDSVSAVVPLIVEPKVILPVPLTREVFAVKVTAPT